MENDMTREAIKKLDTEYKGGKFDRYAEIMKSGVLGALKDFCRQDEEFAQAVVQGGSFENCMKAVAKNCGNGISDLEAYRRAVQFYFHGADIRFRMEIDLCASVRENDVPAAEERKAVMLDLSDFW